MSKSATIGLTIMAASVSLAATPDALIDDFLNPPDSARAETWWHWMGGEVTKDGITADLEAARRMGLGAVQMFNAGVVPDLLPGKDRVLCMDSAWEDMVRHAMRECKRLGLGFYAHNSAGWTGAGGPWIAPSNAMFHIETREVRIESGKEGEIPRPESWPEKGRTYYADIRAYAFPTPPAMMAEDLPAPEISGSDSSADLDLLLRDPESAKPKLYVPKEEQTPGVEVSVEKGEEYFVQYDFGRPVEVRSVGIMAENLFGESPVLFAGDSPGELERICRLPGSVATWEYEGHDVQVAIPRTKARFFRFAWNAEKDEKTVLRRIVLSARPTITAPRAQMAYESRTMTSGNTDQADLPDEAVAPEDIRDVTDRIGEDGVLRWTAPADGRVWTLLRVGYRSKNRNVMPAAPGGVGLECDKFSAETVSFHYDRFSGVLVRLAREAGAIEAFRGILVDSYEAGTQTWTPRMAEEFRARRGYGLELRLPVYGGYIVGSRVATRRFLRDMRQTGSDLISENFYGTLRHRANADGITLAAETCAGGAAGTFVGDGLQHHLFTDFPMTESNRSGAGKRMAVSAADNAGMNIVAMEAHTGAIDWGQHPAQLYAAETGFYADGINRIVFHTMPHNPTLDRVFPGVCFGAWGCCISRGQTWSVQARPWLDTLARTQALLRKGVPVVDVAVYYGEDVMGPDCGLKPPKAGSEPLIGLDADEKNRSGWDWDMLSPHCFLNDFEMAGGRMGRPGGVQYRLLVLRNSAHMSAEIAEKIVRFVKDGLAVSVETVPQSTPGLSGYPECDARLGAAVRELVGDLDGKTRKVRVLGRGLVMRGLSVREALERIGLAPDFRGACATDGSKRARARHRRDAETDIWYVATDDSTEDAKYRCSFRVEGKTPAVLDPLTREIYSPANVVCRGGITEMDLNLSKSQALFVVFREWNAEPPRALPPGAGERIAIGGPWRVRYEGLNAPTNRVLEVLADQTASDEDDLKFFSGTTVYETVFAWDGAPGAATLELGKVGVSAEVRVNGKLLGTAWTKPYRLGGLEKLLRKGENRLDIRTCNTWANRLIGDVNLPESERKTWAMRSRLGRDEPLGKYPSGLIGPVAIRRASPADTIFQDKQEPDPSTLRQLRFLAFNVWGDFFGNPVHERDLQELEIIVGHDPDFIGLQEVTPNFWKSRLVSGLDSAGFECVGAEMGPDDRHRNAANPVFFCKSRFELLEKGSKWFHPELDYSKGVVWAAVREKATGRKFVIFASHFWWEQKSRGDDYLRLANARMLHETVAGAAKRHGASIIGGGDLNAPVSSSALAELKKLGWCDAQEKSPDTDPRATCREMPERDETGVYRGIEHEKAKTPEWLDHVFYSPESITPVKFAMDRTQKALDTSDHSPVIFDFTTEESTLKANVPPPPSGGVVE